MKKDTVKKFAIGTVLAAVAGYVAGILTAPKSGKETRQDIKNKANDTYVAAEKQLKKLHTELSGLLDDANDALSKLKGKSGEELSKAIQKSQVAKQKTREILSSLHEGGETGDKDLQKAISDAKKSIAHLKDFLTK
jgi:gas vesicle protein